MSPSAETVGGRGKGGAGGLSQKKTPWAQVLTDSVGFPVRLNDAEKWWGAVVGRNQAHLIPTGTAPAAEWNGRRCPRKAMDLPTKKAGESRAGNHGALDSRRGVGLDAVAQHFHPPSSIIS